MPIIAKEEEEGKNGTKEIKNEKIKHEKNMKNKVPSARKTVFA